MDQGFRVSTSFVQIGPKGPLRGTANSQPPLLGADVGAAARVHHRSTTRPIGPTLFDIVIATASNLFGATMKDAMQKWKRLLTFSILLIIGDGIFYSVAAEPIPPVYFGMHFVAWQDIDKLRAGAVGKGTMVTWPYLESVEGKMKWGNLDDWVFASQRQGLDFIYTFTGVPRWAARDQASCTASAIKGVDVCHSVPKDFKKYESFVDALVSRYRGKIKYYELWNEPEYDRYISPSEMASLARVEHDVIRRRDPGAKIITPSLNGRHPEYADAYFGSGGTTDVDVVSFHGYASQYADFPEVIDKSYKGYGALLSPLLPVLRKYSIDLKPLWNTEGSWTDTRGAMPNQEGQAAFAMRYLLLQWSSGISRSYWYAWDHSFVGRLENNLAGTGYAEVRRWMQGASMTRTCQVMSNNRDIWTCELSRGSGDVSTAIWDVRGPSHFSVDDVFTHYRTVDGSFPIRYHQVILGTMPILLISEGRTAH
jgi:hypothetical protein